MTPPNANGPVGFFDSGVGGLSVWREAVKLLPCESTVYLADRAHCPYGPRPREELERFCRANTEILLRRGCKLVVVACNTATAAAIDALRSSGYPVGFVGMEPAVKPAALASKTGVVGVLATAGTFKGRLYRETSRRFADRARILVREVKGWVEAVERGDVRPTPEVRRLVRREIQPLLDENADSLVLGCTHFPFLRQAIDLEISESARREVRVYDPAPAVARQIKAVLERDGLMSGNADPGAAHHLMLSTGEAFALPDGLGIGTDCQVGFETLVADEGGE